MEIKLNTATQIIGVCLLLWIIGTLMASGPKELTGGAIITPLTSMEASKVTVSKGSVSVQSKKNGVQLLSTYRVPKAGKIIVVSSATGEVTTVQRINTLVALCALPYLGVTQGEPVLGMNVVRSDDYLLSVGVFLSPTYVGASFTRDITDHLSLGVGYNGSQIRLMGTIDL